MANNSSADVLMQFGVEGGGDIRQGSGKQMYEDIKKIVEEIQKDITERLSFKVDPETLKAMGEEITATLTDALKSVGDTPINFTFTPDDKSVKNTVNSIKNELKKQNVKIDATVNPNSKGKKSAGNGTVDNIKKEAEEASVTIETVFAKAFDKIEHQFKGSSILKGKLEEIKESISSTFSTEEVNTFLNALDHIGTRSGMKQFITALRDADKESHELVQTFGVLKKILDDQYLNTNVLVSKSNSSNQQSLDALSTFKQFVNSKPGWRRDGVEMRSAEYAAWLDKKGIDAYGNKVKGIVNDINTVRSTLRGMSANFQDLMDYTDTNDLDTIYIKDYKGIKQTVEQLTEQIRASEPEYEKYNQLIQQIIASMGIQVDSGLLSLTLDQLEEICQRFPEARGYLQDYIDTILNGFASPDLVESVKDIEDSFTIESSKVVPQFQIIKSEVDNATDSIVKNREELKALFLAMNKSVSQFLLPEYSEAHSDYGNYELFPHTDNFKDSQIMQQAKQELLNRVMLMQEIAQRLNDTFRYIPRIAAESTATINNQYVNVDAEDVRIIEDITDAIEEETEAQEELNEALEKGNELRERTERISMSISEGDNGKTYTTTSRGLNTGRIYTDTIRTTFDKEGNEQVSSSFKFTNSQVNSMLTGIEKKLDVLKEKRDNLLEISTDKTFAKELTENINETIGKAETLSTAISKAANTGYMGDLDRLGFKDIQSAEDTLQKYVRQITSQISKVNADINEQERELNDLAKTQSRVAAYLKEFDNINQLQYNTNTNNSAYQTLQNEATKIQKLSQIVSRGETAFDRNNNAGVTSYAEAVQKLSDMLAEAEARLKEFKATASNITDEAARAKLNEYKEAIAGLQRAPGGAANNLAKDIVPDLKDEATLLQYVKAHYEELTGTISKVRNETTRLNSKYKEEQNIITQRNKLYQEAENYYKKYESGIKANIRLEQQWQDLLKQLHDGTFGEDIDRARRALAELQTTTKDAKGETMTLWGSLKKLFTDHFGSVSATAAIGVMRNVLRGAYQNVLDIDRAMTELRKVTDETESTYKSFRDTAADMAKEVGSSIADAISSTADFARLGFNLDQSTALAKAAMIYKNVGDGIADINEASESIISTIKAFDNIDAEDALSIIDKFNEVGNNYAISSSGIGTALQKSAAALASANNTLDESIALITAGNTVVQNPEVIGTTAKTISMFLRASKTEAEAAGIETEGMAESVSKLREEIKSLSGVDIMLDDKTYKSTYQILREIAEVWSEISDVSQANILERLGGKRNANVVASIIENFDVAENALQTSLNSLGSATEENEKYLESIEGHINKLKVAYEDLSQTVINSDLVKVVIDGLTAITGLANDAFKSFGTLQTLIPVIAGSLSTFKNVGRDKTLSLTIEYADFNVVAIRNELIAA